MTFTPPKWRSGDRIRRQREELGLEQREVAEKAGVHKDTVTNAEKNRPIADLSMGKIADALGAPVAWIRTGEVD